MSIAFKLPHRQAFKIYEKKPSVFGIIVRHYYYKDAGRDVTRRIHLHSLGCARFRSRLPPKLQEKVPRIALMEKSQQGQRLPYSRTSPLDSPSKWVGAPAAV